MGLMGRRRRRREEALEAFLKAENEAINPSGRPQPIKAESPKGTKANKKSTDVKKAEETKKDE